MKSYKTVEKATEARTEVRRSLFIASVSPAATAEEADTFVASVRAKYPDATHNCYAYIAGAENPSVRFSDDGEPGGTAGQPMLEVLKKRGLTAVAVVVTRYFGGIKLGAGGLVSAYTDSVAVDRPRLLSEEGDLGAYLRGKTAVLVPQDVEKYAGAEQLAQLRAFAAAGQVIRCAYEMDEGSFLYLQEKLNRLRERKIG